MANKNKEGFEWPVIVKNANARSSLDYFYGPYDSVDDLDKDEVLPKNLKFPGFTAAVYETVNGKKTLVEYWWTGNGWERKGVPVSTYVTFKGVVETLPSSANVGDLYILKKSNGEDNEEYIWTESGKFELLGKLKAETNGSLNIEGDSFTIDGTTKTTKSFNGIQSVTLHLGKYLTEAEAANIYLKQTDAAKTYLKHTDAANTYLKKTDAANTYLTKTDASNTYLTKTDAKNTYQPKGDYLTKSDADSTYQAKGDYLTKTEASSQYPTKNEVQAFIQEALKNIIGSWLTMNTVDGQLLHKTLNDDGTSTTNKLRVFIEDTDVKIDAIVTANQFFES